MVLSLGAAALAVVGGVYVMKYVKGEPQSEWNCLRTIQIVNDLSLEKRDLYQATDSVIRELIFELKDTQIPHREHAYAPIWDHLYMEQLKCREKLRAEKGHMTPEILIERALQEIDVSYSVYETLKPIEVTADGKIIEETVYRR